MTQHEGSAQLNCEEVVRALWDYLDGRCEPTRRALIEEHLALCEACRSHAEFERKLVAKLAETGRAAEDDSFRERILRALRETEADQDRGA